MKFYLFNYIKILKVNFLIRRKLKIFFWSNKVFNFIDLKVLFFNKFNLKYNISFLKQNNIIFNTSSGKNFSGINKKDLNLKSRVLLHFNLLLNIINVLGLSFNNNIIIFFILKNFLTYYFDSFFNFLDIFIKKNKNCNYYIINNIIKLYWVRLKKKLTVRKIKTKLTVSKDKITLKDLLY